MLLVSSTGHWVSQNVPVISEYHFLIPHLNHSKTAAGHYHYHYYYDQTHKQMNQSHDKTELHYRCTSTAQLMIIIQLIALRTTTADEPAMRPCGSTAVQPDLFYYARYVSTFPPVVTVQLLCQSDMVQFLYWHRDPSIESFECFPLNLFIRIPFIVPMETQWGWWLVSKKKKRKIPDTKSPVYM